MSLKKYKRKKYYKMFGGWDEGGYRGRHGGCVYYRNLFKRLKQKTVRGMTRPDIDG